MEQNAKQHTQEETKNRLCMPEYASIPLLHIEDVKKLLADPTAVRINAYIKAIAQNKTKNALENKLAQETLGLGSSIGSGLILIPAVTPVGSAEEVLGTLVSLALTAVFAKKIHTTFNDYTQAVKAEKGPFNQPVLHLLPMFYDQLAADMQSRIIRLESRLRALRMHYCTDSSEAAISKKEELSDYAQMLTKMQYKLIGFPLDIDKHTALATTRLSEIVQSDAVPSIINRLLRGAWQEWNLIEEGVSTLENALPSRNTAKLTLSEM